MFLREDKAYCFEAAQFQTVPGPNTSNDGMSKRGQCCCQCLPPAAPAMDQHAGIACIVKANIYSLRLFLPPFELLSPPAAKPVVRSGACCRGEASPRKMSQGSGRKKSWGQLLSMRWTQNLATAGQKCCLSNAEMNPPGQGTGAVWVRNNKIQQELRRGKV